MLGLDFVETMQVQFGLDMPFAAPEATENLAIDAEADIGGITVSLGVLVPMGRILERFQNHLPLIAEEAEGDRAYARRRGEGATMGREGGDVPHLLMKQPFLSMGGGHPTFPA